MDEFLKSYFPSIKNLKKEKLPGDGGHRNYTRIRSGTKTFILMYCGKRDSSLKNFIEIQKKLAPLASVPEIFHKDLNQGFLLLEDLGDQSLEQFLLQNGEKSSLPFYHQVLMYLIRFQNKIQPQKTDLIFDKKFFLEENEMAIHHLQTYIHRPSKKKTALWDKISLINFKKDMEKILTGFKPEDYVYCHRDYHSRNLMLNKGKITLIDFQDAGSGPWYYDLASLLYDSYVPLSSSYKKQLSVFYFENLPPGLKKKAHSPSHVQHMIKLQFLQRGFKACGRFSAFKNLDQKSTHLKYILPTLTLLKNSALELSYSGIHKYISHITAALEELSIDEKN